MSALEPLVEWARRIELARFGLIGVGTTILYALICFALIAGGMAAAVASGLAYFLAGLASYLGHKLFTFASGGAHSVEGPRFVVVQGFGFLIALFAPGLAERLGADARFGVVAACVAVPAFNYVAMKIYVFASGGAARVKAGRSGLDHAR